MNNTLNFQDITNQIQQYVKQIKNSKKEQISAFSTNTENKSIFHYTNDVRCNINKLNGESKFNIQNIVAENNITTSSEYASEAYEHLDSIEDKHKVIIDFIHKNNRNFDVKA